MAKDSNVANSFTTNLANNVEALYTNTTNGGAVIKAVTASNTTKINASYIMYIVDAEGAVIKPIVPFQVVIRLKADTPPEAINQVVPPGGSIQVETSAANSIAFTVTVRELILN